MSYMDIRLLRYFLAVAREENITKAAESLHISQPSLSKQIMELEQETGKTLLIRGKRKVTLTDDGVLLRRRADEIVKLLEKTERELSADTMQLSGEVIIGGTPTKTILKAAAKLREEHSDVSFQFYSSDAIDVLEKLEHGSLDFAIFLEPIDTEKYEYISLNESSRWGLLMMSGSELAEKEYIEKADILSVPLIFHRRAGLQMLISHWAETDIENFNIAATYNIVNGSPTRLVESGLGCFLSTEDQLPEVLDDKVCFRLLEPLLEIRYALIWKRYAALSKASEVFLDKVKSVVGGIIK